MTLKIHPNIQKIPKFGLTFLILIYIGTVVSQEIYTWTDSEGRNHYSNEAKDGDAKSVTLPDTERYNSDARIKELRKEAARTCLNRGGVQCSLGEDEDGSVVCSDGTKDSEESFKASCAEVKLLAELNRPKKRLSKQLLRIPVTATVRNQSSQEAKGVSVKVKLPETPNSDEHFGLELEGPTDIPAYGVGEYTFSGRLIDDRIVIKGVISVDCENCLKVPVAEPATEKVEENKEIPLDFKP